MQIIRGKIPGAKKVVIYGPEGIGKSTFASRFPDALFIDTEGSTKELDIARMPTPASWAMLKDQITQIKADPALCRTLVIDTIDWAEQMCVEEICAKHQKRGIEDFGYGNGYVYVKEEFGRFLNSLQEVVERGITVVLTAHAQLRKFEQPDELGAYDRWELKLGKKTSSQTSPLVKEWADMLLFANYKTVAVAVDDKGRKHKAQGGRRVMYTQHHPCWDAKNRYGLPDEVDFDYGVIRTIIEGNSGAASDKGAAVARKPPAGIVPKPEPECNEPESQRHEEPSEQPAMAEKAPDTPSAKQGPPDTGNVAEVPGKEPEPPKLDSRIPKALRDLMEANNVTEWDIQMVVSQRGYYPSDTPIWNYDPDFVAGVLVAAWNQVFAGIREIWKTTKIPF